MRVTRGASRLGRVQSERSHVPNLPTVCRHCCQNLNLGRKHAELGRFGRFHANYHNWRVSEFLTL